MVTNSKEELDILLNKTRAISYSELWMMAILWMLIHMFLEQIFNKTEFI